MILTNNSHRFMILNTDVVDVDTKNRLIYGKYSFNFAENNPNILVVSDSTYKHIMIDIEAKL